MAQTRTKSDILFTPNTATGYLCFYFIRIQNQSLLLPQFAISTKRICIYFTKLTYISV